MIANMRFLTGEGALGESSVIRTVIQTAKTCDRIVAVLARRIASAYAKNGFRSRGYRSSPTGVVWSASGVAVSGGAVPESKAALVPESRSSILANESAGFAGLIPRSVGLFGIAGIAGIVGLPRDAGMAGIAVRGRSISGRGKKGFDGKLEPRNVVQTTSSTKGVMSVRMVVPETTVLTFTFPGSRHFDITPKEPLVAIVEPLIESVFKPSSSWPEPVTVSVFPAKRLGTYVASRINEPSGAEVPAMVIEFVLLAREWKGPGSVVDPDSCIYGNE